jgi:hypothetical protein
VLTTPDKNVQPKNSVPGKKLEKSSKKFGPLTTLFLENFSVHLGGIISRPTDCYIIPLEFRGKKIGVLATLRKGTD